jgi:murein DD-endopeptidase MepM/ murein hydrolase activator NlpD
MADHQGERMTITAQELAALRMANVWANNALSDLRGYVTQLETIIKANEVPPRLLFGWPVGDNPRPSLLPWWLGMSYAQKYPPIMGRDDWHTGIDCNLNIPEDVNAPVYCVANGVVTFAGEVKGWQGEVVTIKHTLEDRRLIWSRYAHIMALPALMLGSTIKRGTLIGNITDYLPKGASGDHLHFDLSWKDLGEYPGDWPGTDIERLHIDYVDPVTFIAGRLT